MYPVCNLQWQWTTSTTRWKHPVVLHQGVNVPWWTGIGPNREQLLCTHPCSDLLTDTYVTLAVVFKKRKFCRVNMRFHDTACMCLGCEVRSFAAISVTRRKQRPGIAKNDKNNGTIKTTNKPTKPQPIANEEHYKPVHQSSDAQHTSASTPSP